MKTKSLLGIITLSLAIFFSACGPKDADIQRNVTEKLNTTTLAVSSVVEDGNVTLSGVVDTDIEKSEAESLVSDVKGVKSVRNNITVRPTPPVVPQANNDDLLRSAVLNGLSLGGYNDVNVTVADSVITLDGNIKRADLKKVMQIANDLNPKRVVNNLTIN